jgi:hypothetical protein
MAFVTSSEYLRFLEHLGRLSDEIPGKRISVEECANAAGLTTEKAQVAIEFLRERAFVAMTDMARQVIWITVPGIEECRRMATPKWRRWMKNETIVTSVVLSLIAAVIGGCIAGGIKEIIVPLVFSKVQSKDLPQEKTPSSKEDKEAN